MKFFILILLTSLFAQVEEKQIKVGSSLPLSGPVAEDGKQRQIAQKAFFTRLNKEGGVHGRKIIHIEMDDGYDPKKTVTNVKQMLETDKVFALLNVLGTPTAAAILPSIEKEKIPFVGAISGAPFLRSPVKKNVFLIRPSYVEESETLIEYLVDKKGIREIGIFFQDDALGEVGKTTLNQAMSKRKVIPVWMGSHKRNDADYSKALESIKKVKPKAVVLWTTSPSAGGFLKEVVKAGIKTQFVAPSPVTVSELNRVAGKEANGIVLAMNFPSHDDTNIPLVQSFRKDLAEIGIQETTDHAFEAYVNAAVFAEILKRTGKDLSRDAFIKTAESMNQFEIGGISFSFSSTNHQALQKVTLVQYEDGKSIPAK